MDHDWPDIPDTPEQRALVKAHNAEIKRLYPNLVQIYPLQFCANGHACPEGPGGVCCGESKEASSD